MRYAAIVGAVLLGGCGPNVADPADLKPPSAWMMRPICSLPKPPSDDGDPVTRAEHEAKLRKCAAARGDQARGLQKYARAVTKK